MLGSAGQTPYDLILLGLLVALCALLLGGAISAPAWTPVVASVVRRGALAVAVVAIAAVLIRTPSHDPFVRLGRVFTMWIPLVVAVLFYGIWSWRAGRW